MLHLHVRYYPNLGYKPLGYIQHAALGRPGLTPTKKASKVSKQYPVVALDSGNYNLRATNY